MRVAEAAIAAFGQHELFAELGEIMDQRFAILVEHLRAHRDFQHDRLAIGAMAVLAHAVGALRRLEVLLIAVVDQRVQTVHDFDDDVAAAPAIAARGTAELDELLAAERHAAVAAVAGADIDLCFVEEFHEVLGKAGRRARQPDLARFRRKAQTEAMARRYPCQTSEAPFRAMRTRACAALCDVWPSYEYRGMNARSDGQHETTPIASSVCARPSAAANAVRAIVAASARCLAWIYRLKCRAW